MNDYNWEISFPDKIKTRRAEYGYTQEQFSEIINISLSSYSKIENGFQKPSLDTLIKIAAKLNLSLDYLIFDSGKSPENLTDIEKLIAISANIDKDKLKHVIDFLQSICNIDESD